MAQAVATSRFRCADGALANMTRCSQTAMAPCRAACGWQGDLSKKSWRWASKSIGLFVLLLSRLL